MNSAPAMIDPGSKAKLADLRQKAQELMESRKREKESLAGGAAPAASGDAPSEPTAEGEDNTTAHKRMHMHRAATVSQKLAQHYHSPTAAASAENKAEESPAPRKLVRKERGSPNTPGEPKPD